MRKRKGLPAAAILTLTVLACLPIWGLGVAVMTTPAPAADAVADTATPELLCIDSTVLAEATEAVQADLYDASIPLDRELQAVLRETCDASGVPLSLALGLIEAESGFQADAVSQEGCFGLCQLNPKYFPADLEPGENIAAGINFLGELLDKHGGDTQAALTAYNAGYDTGSRIYARAVLDKAEKWGAG